MIYEATKVAPIRLTYIVITPRELWKWGGGGGGGREVLKMRSQSWGV